MGDIDGSYISARLGFGSFVPCRIYGGLDEACGSYVSDLLSTALHYSRENRRNTDSADACSCLNPRNIRNSADRQAEKLCMNVS